MSKVRHLTHVGQYAGAPYCGAPRGDDAGIHLVCAYQRGVADPAQWIEKHITCMACRKAYADLLRPFKTDPGAAPEQTKLF
jgi:hypothetical protein